MSGGTDAALDTEVAIVGGGPVGLGLALELGRHGVRCVVVERYAQPSPIPRGQNLTGRTMEIFRRWGAEEAVRAARTIPRDYGMGGLTSYGTLLGPYQYDWLPRELVRPFYAAENERLPQYATEAALRARVAATPTVTTLFGRNVEEVAEEGDGVRIVAASREDGTRRTIHAAYAVGCDGARSTVREAAGITQTRSDHDRLMVLLVFRSTGLHEHLKRFPGKSFFSVLHPDLGGYWQFFGRVDLGSTWFFHCPVPLGTTVDNTDFTAFMHRAAGATFDVELQHVGFWELRFAIADSYRAGRMFVAGDAAHSHPPYGGYGVNTGLEDAANLGWKLAAALRGWAGPGLLDSYDLERRPVFASTASDFIERAINADRAFLEAFDPARDRAAFEAEWAARGSGARDEINAFEPHYEGSPVVHGPPGARTSAVGSHRHAARAGHHLSPAPLSDGRTTYDALGDGFTLLALGADPDGFADAARALGVPLTILRDTRDGGRERYEAGLVLVRPDATVAWAGDTGADPAAILARAAGRDITGPDVRAAA